MMIRPASTRARSTASSPKGFPPAATKAFQTPSMEPGSVTTSNPSSPLKPVRRTSASAPATFIGSGENRNHPSDERSPSVTLESTSRDVGPWIEIIGFCSVTSSIVASRSPPDSRNQSSSPAELIRTQYRSSASLYVFPSSTIRPSAFTNAAYLTWPACSADRSFVARRCTKRPASGPRTSYL